MAIQKTTPAQSTILDTGNTWNKAQSGAFVALTSASNSIAVDLALSNNFNHTLTEDTTLAAPTNAVAGQSGIFHITQASSAKDFDVDSFWYFGATTPTISTTAGAVVGVSYVVEPGATRALCAMVGDTA
jgi:hypothetical protein